MPKFHVEDTELVPSLLLQVLSVHLQLALPQEADLYGRGQQAPVLWLLVGFSQWGAQQAGRQEEASSGHISP